MSNGSLLSRLRAARSAPAAVWIQFAQLYGKFGQSRYYAFIEGRDDQLYYMPAFRQTLEFRKPVCTFACGGKLGVRDAFLKLQTTHGSAVPFCVFIVDADLDELVGTPDVLHRCYYVTSTYSFENAVVSAHALHVILEDLFGLQRHGQLVADADQHFRVALREFHRVMAPVMAVAVLARLRGESPPLEQVSVSRCFRFDDDLRLRTDRAELQTALARLATGAGLPSWRIWLRVARLLRRFPPKRYVRGKHEIQFLCEYIKGVDRVLRRPLQEGGPAAVPVGPRPLLAALSGRLRYPIELVTFLSAR